MEQTFKILLTGDTSNLEKAIKEGVVSVDKLKARIKELKDSMRDGMPLEEFKKTTAEIQRIETALKNVGKVKIKAPVEELGKIAPTSDRAGQALNNLSRIAQDAPYGFIGISNNINPMLESFQRLQRETGSTGSALKAMVAGLTGAGGLGLAVGVVSSLLVVFSGHMARKKRETGEAVEVLDEGTKALQAFEEAAKQAGDRIQGLSNQISYLNQLGSINLKVAFADDFKVNVMDLQGQVVGLRQELLAVNEEIEKAGAEWARLGGIPGMEKATAAAKKQFEELGKKRQEIENKIQINYRQQQLARVTEDRRIADIKPVKIKPTKLEVDWSELKRVTSVNIEDLEKHLAKMVRDAKIRMPNMNISLDPVQRVGDAIGEAERLAAQQRAIDKVREHEEAMQNLAATVSGVVSPAFNDMFSAIFSGENPMKAFFQSIGQSIQQLISQLIAAVIQAIILNALLPKGLADGTKGIGGFFGMLTGLKMARGGIIPPGFGGDAFGPVMLNSGEAVIPLNKLSQYLPETGSKNIQLSGRLRGRDMYLQNARTSKSQGRLS